MKATSRLSQYRSKPIVLLEKYKKEPGGHNKFAWTSQDGRVIPVNEIDDNHLMNIYRVLEKSLAYHEEAESSVFMFGEPNGEMAMDLFMRDISNLWDMISLLKDNLSHIGYEIHKRGLLINQFEKYQIINNP